MSKSTAMKKRWADPKQYPALLANAKRGDRGQGRPPGSPNGYSGKEMIAVRRVVAEQAERIISQMEEDGLIEPVVVVEDQLLSNDNMMAREALKAAIIIMRTPGSVATRLAAASKILEYTKSKPAATVNNNIAAAESFLEMLAKKG